MIRQLYLRWKHRNFTQAQRDEYTASIKNEFCNNIELIKSEFAKEPADKEMIETVKFLDELKVKFGT